MTMKTAAFLFPRTLTCLGLALATTLATTLPAEARTTTVGGPGGTASRSIDRSQGQTTASVTGPNGQQMNRNVTRSDGQVNSTVTNGSGQVLGSRQVSRSASGTSATVTGPQGQQYQRTTTP